MSATAEPTEAKLNDQIAEWVEGFMGDLSDDERPVVTQFFEQLGASDVGAHAIQAGEEAPDFTATDFQGDTVSLSAFLEKGPVVLSFYRGGWCPICSLEFAALRKIYPQIREAGAELIAISPETREKAKETVETKELSFPVLIDPDNAIAAKYGLIMRICDEIQELYIKWGLDIPAWNQEDSWQVPVPATYIIDTTGIIRSAYVDKDYTHRMEPEEILKALG